MSEYLEQIIRTQAEKIVRDACELIDAESKHPVAYMNSPVTDAIRAAISKVVEEEVEKRRPELEQKARELVALKLADATVRAYVNFDSTKQ